MALLGLGKVAAAGLRHRPIRAITWAMALIVASASFVLLTASVRTSEARIQGSVGANFRAAYDILIRPSGSQTNLERDTGLVRPNFETAIYGGITEQQWRTIVKTPGVEVAAPVAYAGFSTMFSAYELDVSDYVSAAPAEQLLRLRTTWMANRGLSKYPGVTPYVYVTTKRGGCADKLIASPRPSDPFSASGPSSAFLACFERVEPGKVQDYTVEINPQFSMLIAGIDPEQENKLVGLDRAMVSGRPLTGPETVTLAGGAKTIPMVAADRTYQVEPLSIEVEDLAPPTGLTLADLLTETRRRGRPPPEPNASYRRVTRLMGERRGGSDLRE